MWRILHWVSLYDRCIVFQTYIIYPGMAYIRFFLCGLFRVFPDVAHIALCLLIWSVYCSSDINDNSCYVAKPVLPDVASFLHFMMWCLLHCRSWSGAYIVLQIYITFPDMAYNLYFLMWRTFCISWCGVQYIVSSDAAYIFFFRHRWRFLIELRYCISWCGVLFVFPDVAYNTLDLLIWRMYWYFLV